jgi:hypothetical protein
VSREPVGGPEERACRRRGEATDWWDIETGWCAVCSQLPECCESHEHVDDYERDGTAVRLYRCPHGQSEVSVGLALPDVPWRTAR